MRIPWKTWLMLARVPSAAALVAALAAGFSVGPLVRSRVEKLATARGLIVRVDGVVPGFFAVHLRGVHVEPEGVPTVYADLANVDVELGVTFAPRSIDVEGGTARIDGDFHGVVEELKAWRARHASAESTTGVAKKSPLVLRGAALALHTTETDGRAPLEATGIGFEHADGEWTITVEQLSSGEGPVAAAASSVRVVARDGVVTSLGVVSAEIGYTAPLPPPIVTPVDPDPTPEPPIRTVAARPHHPKGAPAEPNPVVAPVHLPDLRAIRARITTVAKLAFERLPPSESVHVDALALHYQKGADRFDLGPGPFDVRRKGDDVAVSFSTRASANGAAPDATPFSLEGDLPTRDGDAADAVVTLRGGPLPLALLGVRERGFGIVDVARASFEGRGRVALDGNADALTFDLDVAVRGFGLDHPKIAHDPVHGLDVAVAATGVLKGDELRVDNGSLAIGAFHVRGSGDYAQTGGGATGSLDFEIPTAACQALLASVPPTLLPELAGATMTGTFGGRGFLRFDTQDLDALALKYAFDDRCRMATIPDLLSRGRFSRPFYHRVYRPNGTLEEETTGPGTDAWTDIGDISPFMQVAVLTTEDGSFLHHHGFNHAAIRNALVADIKAGRFVRGASTITMQLAKNLFLTREKTLSRKLEELILTDYLEEEFSKSELMELYLNVIEFGPDLYGIGPAARHYFGRPASELDLAESLFLSSILPSPVASHRMYEKGSLPDYWAKRITDLMRVAQRNGKISEAELQEGLGESVVFHDEKDPPPPPRPPITSSHLFGDDADDSMDGWKEIPTADP